MTEHVSGGPAASAFIDQAKNYRAQGGGRPELVDYLQRCGVDAAGAEVIADRFDLELGLAGVARPGDVSPAVAAQLAQRTPSAPAATANTASTIEAEIHAAVEQAPQAVAGTAQAVAPAPVHPAPAATPVSITTIEITPPAAVAPAPAPTATATEAQVAVQTEAAPAPTPTATPATQPAVDASPQPMTLAEYLGSPTPDTPAALATPVAPVQPAVKPANPVAAPTPAAPAAAPAAEPAEVPPSAVPPVAETAAAIPSAPMAPTPAAPAAAAPASTAPTPPAASSNVAPAMPMAASPTTARAPRPESSEADATPWQETTDFGYKIAQSWDDGDPNEAINSANELARAGKSQEEIVEYLLECNVSPGEAEYVAAMTGARRTKRPETTETVAKPSGGGRRVALAIAMVIAGLVVMYLGWSAYQSGTDTGRRSPLGIVAVGGALVLNALRTLIRR